MSKALYRKYRSTSFDEVVGQQHVTDLLKNAINTGKIAHAYLLTGPRGVGKTSVARIIAHEVNGLAYSEDTELDIIEIDAASNRRIDDIRDLREKVHIAPVSSKYKVYIIDEVHMLTGESFNALLKTLEEPPSHVIFILATTEVHKVPATIVSRTQRYHFRPAANPDIVKHLAFIARQENIPFEDDALELIATHAAGSFRDSVSLLDQLSGLSETITAPLVESVLGMAPRERVDALVRAIQDGDIDEMLSVIDELQSQGISPTVLTTQITRRLNLKAKTDHALFGLIDRLLDAPKAYDPQLKLMATLVNYIRKDSAQTERKSSQPTSPTTKPVPAIHSIPEQKMPPENEPSKKQPSKSTKKDSTPTESTQKSAEEFDWGKVLETTKTHHKPLYSVLSRAQVQFEDNSLHLTFTYVLHRKKLENNTYRNQLFAVIKDLFNVIPEIIVDDIKNPAKAQDPTIQAVADIMGGGEVVNESI